MESVTAPTPSVRVEPLHGRFSAEIHLLCPLCPVVLRIRPRRHKSVWVSVRRAFRGHLATTHWGLGIRERSLLEDDVAQLVVQSSFIPGAY
jgi:hypothetical protein